MLKDPDASWVIITMAPSGNLAVWSSLKSTSIAPGLSAPSTPITGAATTTSMVKEPQVTLITSPRSSNSLVSQTVTLAISWPRPVVQIRTPLSGSFRSLTLTSIPPRSTIVPLVVPPTGMSVKSLDSTKGSTSALSWMPSPSMSKTTVATSVGSPHDCMTTKRCAKSMLMVSHWSRETTVGPGIWRITALSLTLVASAWTT